MSPRREMRMNRRRNVILGGCLLAAIALLGVAQARLDAVAATQSVRAPRFALRTT